jgi:transposase
MGRAYSEDLRMRVLGAVDAGLSKMQVCRTYRIARSTLDDWLALREQTGQVASKPANRRGPIPALTDQSEVHEFIQRHRHCTLSQMALAWEQEAGQRLTVMTFCNSLRRLGYTRKKRATSTASETLDNVRRSWSESR